MLAYDWLCRICLIFTLDLGVVTTPLVPALVVVLVLLASFSDVSEHMVFVLSVSGIVGIASVLKLDLYLDICPQFKLELQ